MPNQYNSNTITESVSHLITDSESTSTDEEIDCQTEAQKWSQIGQELRLIADCFGTPEELDEDGNSLSPFGVNDLVSLINLMLPITVPQSLWSALLSYAAWKIFKKFQ